MRHAPPVSPALRTSCCQSWRLSEVGGSWNVARQVWWELRDTRRRREWTTERQAERQTDRELDRLLSERVTDCQSGTVRTGIKTMVRLCLPCWEGNWFSPDHFTYCEETSVDPPPHHHLSSSRRDRLEFPLLFCDQSRGSMVPLRVWVELRKESEEGVGGGQERERKRSEEWTEEETCVATVRGQLCPPPLQRTPRSFQMR